MTSTFFQTITTGQGIYLFTIAYSIFRFLDIIYKYYLSDSAEKTANGKR